jgi:hypothetical protein
VSYDRSFGYVKQPQQEAASTFVTHFFKSGYVKDPLNPPGPYIGAWQSNRGVEILVMGPEIKGGLFRQVISNSKDFFPLSIIEDRFDSVLLIYVSGDGFSEWGQTIKARRIKVKN